jgi:hypothetical protein
LPGFWLAFSLTYSRGNYREFLQIEILPGGGLYRSDRRIACFRSELVLLLPPAEQDGLTLSLALREGF